MRVIVCVKQVYDPKTVKISRSREELDLREAVLITNPADRIALEAALKLRDAAGAEVVALSAGPASADDAVREAIAMGADRGVLVRAEGALEGAAVTRLLAAAISRIGQADLVLTGSRGGFNGTGGTAPRLAAELGWPVLIAVVRLDAKPEGLLALVAAGTDGELRPVATPAVLAIGEGGEQPRYPHPARIANAWGEGLVETWDADALGVTLVPDIERGGLILSPERVRGQVIGGAQGSQLTEAAGELVGILRTKRLI